MKAKIFYGPASSGKSRTADMLQQILGTDNTIYLSGKTSKEKTLLNTISNQITIDTRLIIIDDLRKNFDFQWFYSILPHGRFVSNKEFREPLKEFYLPNVLIVFTTNHKPKLTDSSFLGRFDLIEFPSSYFNFEMIPSENQKEQILKDFFDNAKGEELIKLSTFFLATLGEQLIKSNAGEMILETTIHPDGVDVRRKVKMAVTQIEEIEEQKQ